MKVKTRKIMGSNFTMLDLHLDNGKKVSDIRDIQAIQFLEVRHIDRQFQKHKGTKKTGV